MKQTATQLIIREQLAAGHGPLDALYIANQEDPGLRPDFFSLLYRSELFVLENQGKIYSYAKGGQVFVPLFSSVAQIHPFIVGTELHRYRRMKPEQLLSRLGPDVSVIFNPKSRYAKILSAQELGRNWSGGFSSALSDEVSQISAAFIQAEPEPISEIEPVSETVVSESFEMDAVSEPVIPAPSVSRPSLPPLPQKKPAAVVRRHGAAVVPPKPEFPRTLAHAVCESCRKQELIEKAYLAWVDESGSRRITIGVSLAPNSEDATTVDDLLTTLALSIDSAIDGNEAVEICIVEESEQMLDLIQSRKARQIYLQSF